MQRAHAAVRLTTKGRYAVTAMLDLALHQDAGPVSLAEIAERQNISLSYLEQLFGRLKRAELLVSVRGPGGGYHLARPGSEVSVADIIAGVGEGIDATRCGGAGDCNGGDICLTHNLWADLSSRIDGFLREIHLSDLVGREVGQEVGQGASDGSGERVGAGAGHLEPDALINVRLI